FAALAVVASGCTTATSATDLHPEGPPMIEQVRLTESAMVDGVTFDRPVFAFGTHPDAPESDVHHVTSAEVSAQKLRSIMDELLRGNNLEEIQCRFGIDVNRFFGRVPLGATPDDIARCSGAQEVLPRTCPGSNPHSVCLCLQDAGCSVTKSDNTVAVVPKG